MKYIFTIILIVCSFVSNAQSDKQKEKAEKSGLEAIDLMNVGNYDKALTLLLKAYKIHPDRLDYPYEIAYALYHSKLYDGAIEWLVPLKSHPDVSDIVFQLLGNAYDLQGNPDKAIETYKSGLEIFPQSGKLYLESGSIENTRKNYNKAIQYWEAGINAEPNYSSNYYWLAKTFARTEERIWALLYGELFIDLELGTKRTEEISKLLYDNYQLSYKTLTDSTGEFELTKKGFELILEDKKDLSQIKKKGLPFEGTFATVYSFSALDFHEKIDMKSIYTARVNFINNWFQKHNENYPNKLFDYQKRMIEEGIFEAYSYWLIRYGELETFNEWYKNNEDQVNQFAIWIQANSIGIKKSDLYNRLHY